MEGVEGNETHRAVAVKGNDVLVLQDLKTGERIEVTRAELDPAMSGERLQIFVALGMMMRRVNEKWKVALLNPPRE